MWKRYVATGMVIVGAIIAILLYSNMTGNVFTSSSTGQQTPGNLTDACPPGHTVEACPSNARKHRCMLTVGTQSFVSYDDTADQDDDRHVCMETSYWDANNARDWVTRADKTDGEAFQHLGVCGAEQVAFNGTNSDDTTVYMEYLNLPHFRVAHLSDPTSPINGRYFRNHANIAGNSHSADGMGTFHWNTIHATDVEYDDTKGTIVAVPGMSNAFPVPGRGGALHHMLTSTFQAAPAYYTKYPYTLTDKSTRMALITQLVDSAAVHFGCDENVPCHEQRLNLCLSTVTQAHALALNKQDVEIMHEILRRLASGQSPNETFLNEMSRCVESAKEYNAEEDAVASRQVYLNAPNLHHSNGSVWLNDWQTLPQQSGYQFSYIRGVGWRIVPNDTHTPFVYYTCDTYDIIDKPSVWLQYTAGVQSDHVGANSTKNQCHNADHAVRNTMY